MSEEGLSDNVKLHTKIARLCSVVEEQNRLHDRLMKTVYGDGNGETGLVISVDRLKQSHNRNKWTVRTVLAGILGWLVTYFKIKTG